MEFNEVPIACVEPSWLPNVFLPKLRGMACDTGTVHLMPTDSARESDFLCMQIRNYASTEIGKTVVELKLDARDPTLNWDAVYGGPDGPPEINTRHGCDVLIVRNGNYLPLWFVEDQLDYIVAFAESFGMHVLLPLSRVVAEHFVGRMNTIEVPSLADFDEGTIRCFTLGAIENALADLRDEGELIDRSAARAELCQLILSDLPESRTRIEDALEFYANTVDFDAFQSTLEYAKHVPPKVAGRRFSEPALIEPRDVLRRTFDSNVEMLRNLQEVFEGHTGYQLLEAMHDLPHPFDSFDPLHWFIGSVSYLGCLFFDAGKKRGLPVVMKYGVDADARLLPRGEPDEFSLSLRTLRTYFQHNLNPQSVRDRRIIAEAEQWFQESTLQAGSFSRYGGRLYLANLLDDLGNTVRRIDAIVRQLGGAKQSRDELRRELDRAARTVAEHEIDGAIKQVIQEQDLDLDCDEVVKQYQARIVKDVRESRCKTENIGDHLVRVCERYCHEMACEPPRIGQLLKEQGLEGRQIGKCSRRLVAEWEANPQMGNDEYLNLARAEAARILAEQTD